jgi:hypothetical protein
VPAGLVFIFGVPPYNREISSAVIAVVQDYRHNSWKPEVFARPCLFIGVFEDVVQKLNQYAQPAAKSVKTLFVFEISIYYLSRYVYKYFKMGELMVNSKILREELANLPTVKYPDEVVERWNKEAEIARLQLATREIVPKTAYELAAELGISLDD